jgi:hypothetical protein
MTKTFKTNPKITKKYEDKLNYMLNKYSRVLQTRIDLRYPADGSRPAQADDIYRFHENTSKRLKNQNYLPDGNNKRFKGRDGKEIQYPHDAQILTVREQSQTAINPHFHSIILLNGMSHRNDYYVFKVAESVWGNILEQKQTNHSLVNKASPSLQVIEVKKMRRMFLA